LIHAGAQAPSLRSPDTSPQLAILRVCPWRPVMGRTASALSGARNAAHVLPLTISRPCPPPAPHPCPSPSFSASLPCRSALRPDRS
jgi:hypothetical protein